MRDRPPRSPRRRCDHRRRPPSHPAPSSDRGGLWRRRESPARASRTRMPCAVRRSRGRPARPADRRRHRCRSRRRRDRPTLRARHRCGTPSDARARGRAAHHPASPRPRSPDDTRATNSRSSRRPRSARFGCAECARPVRPIRHRRGRARRAGAALRAVRARGRWCAWRSRCRHGRASRSRSRAVRPPRRARSQPPRHRRRRPSRRVRR